MRYGNGTIRVFTFKDGLLARAAHDLQLHFGEFEVGLEGEEVHAELPLPSLAVDGPVENGVVRPGDYDAAKRADVERVMHGEVLHTDRQPTARFVGRAVARGAGFAVDGELTLTGRTAPLSFDVREDGGTYRATFELVPSRWGIAPYRALLGAIRLKDSVRVELALTEA
jgi:hypothetical protein